MSLVTIGTASLALLEAAKCNGVRPSSSQVCKSLKKKHENRAQTVQINNPGRP